MCGIVSGISVLRGLVILAQKHTSATKVMDNSRFFITTNVLPNFGISADHNAIYNSHYDYHPYLSDTYYIYVALEKMSSH